MESEELKYLVVNKKEQIPSTQSDWAKRRLIWVPHEVQSFCAAGIIGEDGDCLTVLLEESGKQMTVPRDECQKMNPPKYHKLEDMSELVCLNDASVLFNIKDRYFSNLIYVSKDSFQKSMHICIEFITRFKEFQKNDRTVIPVLTVSRICFATS